MLTCEFVKGSKCFEKEVIEDYKDKDLIWLLLVDTYAILQYIDYTTNNNFEVWKWLSSLSWHYYNNEKEETTQRHCYKKTHPSSRSSKDTSLG
ncbi:hypothetical protein CFP56_002162 [Quercus suber]|uniref:Uncharacterized protein n=1 Tax=Quercus suber TaxID=58331 RepID=A0AAW0M803_QUESU